MYHSSSSQPSYYPNYQPPQSIAPTHSHASTHSHSSSRPHRHSHSQSQPHSHSHSRTHSRPTAAAPQQAYNAAPPRSQWPMSQNELYQIFQQVDADRSGAISVIELQRALRNEDWQPFDFDTVKMLMNYFDRDHNGTISFDEFAGLFKYINEWQQVFKHFDRDNSHSIDKNELQAALTQFGYNLSPQLYSVIVRKYSSLPSSEVGSPSQAGISFDRFVRACVSIKWLSESFQRRDTDRDGLIQLHYEEFMRIFFEAP